MVAPSHNTHGNLDPADLMKMRFACRQCGATYRVTVRLAGKLVRCRHCRAPMQIPRSPDLQAHGDEAHPGLQLPTRVSHAPYLNMLESHISTHVTASQPVATAAIPQHTRWLNRLLIVANVAVLLTMIAVIASLWFG